MFAGPAHDKSRVAKSKIALEAMSLRLQTVYSFSAENKTMRTKVNRIRGFAEKLGREGGEFVVQNQNEHSLSANSGKIRTGAEGLGNLSTKPASEE